MQVPLIYHQANESITFAFAKHVKTCDRKDGSFVRLEIDKVELHRDILRLMQ